MQKNIIYIILSLFWGCTALPRSEGESNQVVIFASPEDKLQIQPFMNKVFEKIIHTPQRELEIKISWQVPWEIELYKYRPNLIIISLDHPTDSTGDRLLQRFQSMQSQKDNIFIAEDLFAKNQQLVGIHAQDAIHFQEIINKNGQWLKKEINTSINENIWQYMLEKGKNEALQDSVLSRFGIIAFIQADYQLIALSQDFLWLGRGYPYRWLTFTSLDSSHFLTVSEAWKAIEKNLESNMPQINLLEILRSEDRKVIEGVPIRVMRGVYEHIESSTGGPFVIYLFEGHRENEVILISGFLNNPGHEKVPLLRQLELTIQKMNFNRGEDE